MTLRPAAVLCFLLTGCAGPGPADAPPVLIEQNRPVYLVTPEGDRSELRGQALVFPMEGGGEITIHLNQGPDRVSLWSGGLDPHEAPSKPIAVVPVAGNVIQVYLLP